MRPQFNDLLFGLVIVLVREEETLEDLRDITHVVDVVSLLGGGQEV